MISAPDLILNHKINETRTHVRRPIESSCSPPVTVRRMNYSGTHNHVMVGERLQHSWGKCHYRIFDCLDPRPRSLGECPADVVPVISVVHVIISTDRITFSVNVYSAKLDDLIYPTRDSREVTRAQVIMRFPSVIGAVLPCNMFE